jgi:type VI secretion system protein VasJ
MRGRKNAMEWLVERLRTILPNLPVEAWPTAKRDAFLDDLNAIDRFLSGNMDDTPMLLPLINELSSLVTILPEEATPQDVPPAETSAPATLAGPAVSPPPASRLINPDGEGGETWIRQGLEALGRASACLMARGVADPLAYRLNRIAAWGAVTDLPPAAGSRTLLPGPDSQVVGLLQNLYRSERWEDLLQAAESRVPQFLFWMDLSRYTALSLERLGHESARHAVVSETRHYIERLEGLEGLAFEDGTPFADEETRAWIKTLRGRYPESGEKASPDNGPSVPLDVETALVEARRQIVDNRLSEAMQPFCSVLRGGFASMKERFAWQHGFCRLLLDMKQPRLALPHLLDLLEAIDIYRIDQWEPPLAVAAMQTILKGLRIQPEKDERRIEDLLSRLSRIDPLKAMDFF